MLKVSSRPLLFIHTIYSIQLFWQGQQRPRSDCADAQSDQGLRCSHMPEDTLWCGNVVETPSNFIEIQSTLVISNSKGLSEILRDIRTSTYQICRNGEKLIRLTTFNKYMCNWTLEVRDILKILWKKGNFSSFPQYFCLLLDFHI